jgi:endo-1,4-beta-xylanase
LLLGAVLAVGCGGGGGTTPSPVPTPTPTAPAGPAWNEVAPLRDSAAAAGKLIGAALFASGVTNEPVYAAAAARHFSYLTAEWEMKWNPVQLNRGQFDFARGDTLVAFAEAHGMQVKGHALLWHSATPAWVGTLPPAELHAAVEEHIHTVMRHYRGRVQAWDVVNEAIDDGRSGLRDTVFSRGLGSDYVAEAFRMARRADPDAKLIYNDYGAEGMNRKSNDVYALVSDLKRQGLVDGVGLQMHVTASGFPPLSEMAANVRRLAELGLQVNISEMDVRIASLPAATKWDRQRQAYRDIVAVCVAEPRCDAVTLWGFTDAHSWIDSAFAPDDPLVFDEVYRAKPAFFGVEDAFLRR